MSEKSRSVEETTSSTSTKKQNKTKQKKLQDRIEYKFYCNIRNAWVRCDTGGINDIEKNM